MNRETRKTIGRIISTADAAGARNAKALRDLARLVGPEHRELARALDDAANGLASAWAGLFAAHRELSKITYTEENGS